MMDIRFNTTNEKSNMFEYGMYSKSEKFQSVNYKNWF